MTKGSECCMLALAWACVSCVAHGDRDVAERRTRAFLAAAERAEWAQVASFLSSNYIARLSSNDVARSFSDMPSSTAIVRRVSWHGRQSAEVWIWRIPDSTGLRFEWQLESGEWRLENYPRRFVGRNF